MLWKDFFYFSRGERRAIVLLLALIVLGIGARIAFPFMGRGGTEGIEPDSLAVMEKFLAGVHEMEKERKEALSRGRKKAERKAVLFPFDPNTADSIELSRLGLPAYVVRNVMKYRQAGGKFARADAFSRIYGMTEERFKLLRPYIYISEAFGEKKDTLHDAAGTERRDTSEFYKYPEGTLVELNGADTTELKKVPGIGIGVARSIVAYRERLGGFYELCQLQEVKYVQPDMLKWFKLDSVSVRRINVNKAGLDRLRAHPYLNFYQAKVIVEYRRERGKITSLSQLSLYEEFTGKDLDRLSHYLAFD